MASYINSVTDSDLNSPSLPTDYGFLQNNMRIKEGQYQQGVQSAAAGYRAITSQPVTNAENQQAQRQYIQQIQEGLKTVSKTDLSLPKNVAQAESLYAPFWDDNDLLKDIGITKDAHTKLQSADSDRQSKDEKIRSSYNPWSVQRQQYVLEDLKMAKRGDGSINRVQTADYLPITDYQAYIDEQDKLAGFKGITTQTVNGPVLVTETNGVKAVPQLKTRYDAMLGSKFQAEFAQQGWVEHRQELDVLARLHPEISREELNNKLAENKYHEVADYYDNKLQSYSNDLFSTFQIPIKAIYDLKQKQGGKLTPQQEQGLMKLEAGQEQFNGRLDQLSTEREQFIKANPDEKIGDIAANPEHYYAKLARDATINKLAETQATNYSNSIELNKVWDAVSTHREKEAEISIQRQQLGATKQNQYWEHEDRNRKIDADLLMNGINPQTGASTTSANPSGGISGTQVLGENTTDQQHVNFANVLNSQKNELLSVAAGASFGVNGTSERLSDIGVSGQDLLHYNTLMNRLYGGNMTNTQFSQKPEEKQAFQSVRKALSTYLGHDIPNTYDDVAKAQNEYISNELKRRSGDLKHPMTKDDPYMQAYTQSRVATDALNRYKGKVQEEQTALKQLTIADKNAHRQLLNDAGTNIAGVSDMATYAPVLDVVDDRGTHRTISKEEYAQAYLNKTVNHPDGQSLILNGKKYNVVSVNGRPNTDEYIEHGMHSGYPALNAVHGMMNRFGSYEDRDNLNQSLQGKVAGSMTSVTDKTGRTGMNISYGFGNEKNPGNGEKMIMEAIQPANYTDILVDGKSVLNDSKDLNKILGASGSYSEIRKKLGQPTYSTVSSTGQDVVRFTVSDWDGNGNSKVVEIPLSPRVSGELLSSIPKSTGLYVYNELQHGKVLTSDDNDKSMGFRYEVSPDNADNPTYAKVKTQHIEVNPKTGEESWVDNPVLNIRMSGAGGYNPDLIMAGVSQKRYDAISRLAEQRRIYNAQNAR